MYDRSANRFLFIVSYIPVKHLPRNECTLVKYGRNIQITASRKMENEYHFNRVRYDVLSMTAFDAFDAFMKLGLE